MIDTVTMQELDDETMKGCENPACNCKGKLELTAKCHPEDGVTVRYLHGSGLLSIECRGCGTPTVQIAVAASEVH